MDDQELLEELGICEDAITWLLQLEQGTKAPAVLAIDVGSGTIHWQTAHDGWVARKTLIEDQLARKALPLSEGSAGAFTDIGSTRDTEHALRW
jgi:hypothetical protein